jgi:hypothetical protein
MWALLLKAAVPFMVAAAAHAQARFVPDVCSVYGVTLPLPAEGNTEQGRAGVHPGDCALASLLGSTPPPQPATVAVQLANDGALPVLFGSPAAGIPDRITAWAARLRHGPPLQA